MSFHDTPEGKFYTSMRPQQMMLSNSLAVNMIVKCRLTMLIVDSPHFRRFVADLDSKFVIPCQQTVSNSTLPVLLRIQQEKLQNFLHYVSMLLRLLTSGLITELVHSLASQSMHSMLAIQYLDSLHSRRSMVHVLERELQNPWKLL